ncbi:MAG: hypothetical protein QOI58_2237 [Thermoanaerobaculia bacterium]|jgi:hypothetical protein|nr:hypothetical protein [Thermoanaerobaculia bacterium]
MSLEDVEGWMEVGELEGIEVRGSVVLPWDELVSFAMGFWEQADIEAALGAELAEALPELLMLSDLEVRIPRMESWRWRNWRRGTDNRLTRSSLASCAISCRRNRSGWRQ